MDCKPIFFIFFLLPSIFCFEASNRDEAPDKFENGKIVGGYDGNIADLNYQVSVQMFHRGSYKHFCGGSIIAASHIISAAHCYDNNIFNFYGVRAGSNTTKSGGQFRSVLSTQVHPSYDSMTIDYDVAILKLRTPLNFGALVQPIPLAPLGKFIDAKVRATVSGWGATRFNGRSVNNLQAVSVPVVDWSTCKSIYAELTDNMICAGDVKNGGIDSCQGDSGGPFVQIGETGRVLTGIVSWGYQCASKGYPGVYAKISSLRSWIDSVLI